MGAPPIGDDVTPQPAVGGRPNASAITAASCSVSAMLRRPNTLYTYTVLTAQANTRHTNQCTGLLSPRTSYPQVQGCAARSPYVRPSTPLRAPHQVRLLSARGGCSRFGIAILSSRTCDHVSWAHERDVREFGDISSHIHTYAILPYRTDKLLAA
ncbi:hypothetical protein L226DRAFT_64266 [Lentinus tigrinus ALCF2SS1-7]|uniref:Uncharacterized protein n=1 Tax=Lentinus tigrinus ALCF2SS1-6 TaxID=1328759 RepID=A0A5C2S8H5_9APHY|nr:hypothetical protein L227DRAFT_104825 [Lentinus tigrinus ALCF2SS1-6]RPD74752.1 hypothetical protein L226DRAFT_64266 [Lentinus tigrinus ALCF2SS1-7]